MRKIRSWFNDSSYIDPLSPACKMCAEGSKMVLVVTGLCSASCFYCPLSFKKGGKDIIFADEWKLDNEDDVQKLFCEAEYINAKGAGITGGDPLLVWNRVIKYIRLLKENFGEKFHIHLYTSSLKNTDHISDFVTSGLDEIRFHPIPNSWNDIEKSPISDVIKNTVEYDVDTAIEIPALPNMEDQIISLVKWANETGLKWVNINELEFSERNYNALENRGYKVKDDISAAVKGSQETAQNVLNKISQENLTIGVHYCSLSFKDGVQLTNRIKRRAKNIAKQYEVISDEGLLIKGAIYSEKQPLNQLFTTIKQKYNIPEEYLFLDKEKQRIEIGLWILEKIAKELQKQGFKCYMIEEYPTADRLEVEQTPLPL